jgi:hypothetical protein
MKRLHTLLLLLAALAFLAPAFALRADQSDALAGARARFEALAPAERARIEERWQRYQALSPDEQHELDVRAQRTRELRRRAENRLAPPLRARVQALPEPQRERILSELVEGEATRIGARMRAVLPPDVVQRLEQARPEDRARYFAKYQAQQRKRVTSYMLERLGGRLGLAKEEIDGLKQLPEEQRSQQVLELRQRLTQAETREQGLPPGLSQEEWDTWLKLPPEDFFERLADHVRERQLAGAEAGIGRSGARPPEIPEQNLQRVRGLRRLLEASQVEPADLVELADAAPELRAEEVEARTRQRCLRVLTEERLAEGAELERLQRLPAAAFAGAVHELLAPLRAPWKAPAQEKH